MSENQKYIAPEWAKKVIWYQIFPERFRNGNPSSNPTVKILLVHILMIRIPLGKFTLGAVNGIN